MKTRILSAPILAHVLLGGFVAAPAATAQNRWSGSSVASFCATCNVGLGVKPGAYRLWIAGEIRFGSNGPQDTDLRLFTEPTPLAGYNQTNSLTPLTAPASGVSRTALRLKSAVSGGTNQMDLIVDGGIGIGTAKTEGAALAIGSGKWIQLQADPGNDTTQAATAIMFASREAGGSTHWWQLYTAAVGGGFGVPVNAFSIWDVAGNAGTGSCCNERFTIRPTLRNSAAPRIATIDSQGNLGLGTGAPAASLHVVGQGPAASELLDNYGSTSPELGLRYARGSTGTPTAVAGGDLLGSISGRGYGRTTFSAARARIDFVAAENWSDTAQGASLAFQTTARGAASPTERLRIDASGNVGIGTAPTANRLEVAGNASFSGTVAGSNIAVKHQDLAEWVPTRALLAPGTVVVLDPERSNEVIAARFAYDTRVAGVVSSSPGLVLGEGGEGKALVATTGRVKVRVDATQAPIRVGDLLVTSNREGCAMRSEPVAVSGVAMHRPGTLIGKALEPLASGTGEILVLLSLQ